MKIRLTTFVITLFAVTAVAVMAVAQPAVSYDPGLIKAPTLLTGQLYSEYLFIRNKGDEVLYVTLKKANDSLWLWFNQTELTLLPGEEQAVVVNVLARAVPCMDGDYEDIIVISSNDPMYPEELVPVTMEAVPAQIMYPVYSLIWFGVVNGPALHPVRLMNGGCQVPLTITGVTTSDPMFWLPRLKFPVVVQPGEEFRFDLLFVPPLRPGTYLGTMTVTSDDPVNPVVNIPIEARYTGPGLSMSDQAVRESTWGAIKALYE